MTSDEALHGLSPDRGRGRFLDDRMHADLASSLRHVAERTEDAVQEISRRIMSLAVAVEGGRRVPPLAFRQYFRLVQAVLTEDFTSVQSALDRMEALGARDDDRRVRYFGAPEADQVSLELISDGMRLAPITQHEAEAFELLLEQGLALMERSLPELHAEIDGMVREILFARAPHGDRMEFDGASHYQFWGLLLLNPSHHRTPLAVVEVLAHEASHSMLFALTRTEPLVFNPDDELYPSPLRIDPRPMDGIYHATFVSARMWWAMDQLSRSEVLSPDDRALARDAAEKDRANWTMGMKVIDAHARLSPTGARMLEGTRIAMTAG